MSGARLGVRFAADADLVAAPTAQVWGCGGPPWADGYRASAEFAEEVEAHPLFVMAIGRQATAIYQDRV